MIAGVSFCTVAVVSLRVRQSSAQLPLSLRQSRNLQEHGRKQKGEPASEHAEHWCSFPALHAKRPLPLDPHAHAHLNLASLPSLLSSASSALLSSAPLSRRHLDRSDGQSYRPSRSGETPVSRPCPLPAIHPDYGIPGNSPSPRNAARLPTFELPSKVRHSSIHARAAMINGIPFSRISPPLASDCNKFLRGAKLWRNKVALFPILALDDRAGCTPLPTHRNRRPTGFDPSPDLTSFDRRL